jgi:Subtilase family
MRSEMKKWAIASVVGALGVLGLGSVAGGCFEAEYRENSVVSVRGAEGGVENGVIPGEYIIVFKGKFAEKLDETMAFVKQQGGTVMHEYRPLLPAFAAQIPDAALKQLTVLDAIDYIEANRIIRPTSVQSCTPSWGLDRIDQEKLPLNDAYAWSLDSNGHGEGEDVDVYVFDTGIEELNPDFQIPQSPGQSPKSRVFGGFFAQTQSTAPTDWADVHGHGTHVAGVIGGTHFGVAKRVNLYAVKIFDCAVGSCNLNTCQGSSFDVGEAVKHVAAQIDQRKKKSILVFNFEQAGAPTSFMADMVAAGNQLGTNAPLNIVSAGNANADACMQWYSFTSNPNQDIAPYSLIVGASTKSDARATFSNFGPCVELFAPGEEITSTLPANSCYGASNGVLSGTSQAAAHVAGVAARLWSSTPGATAEGMHNTLKGSVVTGNIDTSDQSPNKLIFAPSLTEGSGINHCQMATASCTSDTEFVCCNGKTKCNESIVCDNGNCAPCGLDGMQCCQDVDGKLGDECGINLTCVNGKKCECGLQGQPCCGGPGGSCTAPYACDDGACGGCGLAGKPCCNGVSCASGFSCNGSSKCVACGGPGQACCDGLSCQSGTECLNGECKTCGGTNQPCCEGLTCETGAECSAGMCIACGDLNEPCCGASKCRTGFACKNDACTACGGPGQDCCDGFTCSGNLACDAGKCEGKCQVICRNGYYLNKDTPAATHLACNAWAEKACTELGPAYEGEYRVTYNGTLVGGDNECGSNNQACCLKNGGFCNQPAPPNPPKSCVKVDKSDTVTDGTAEKRWSCH